MQVIVRCRSSRWFNPAEEEVDASFNGLGEFFSCERSDVCLTCGNFEVCVESEGLTIRESDGGVLCSEVDRWIDAGEPWHSEDEIKVTKTSDSGSA